MASTTSVRTLAIVNGDDTILLYPNTLASSVECTKNIKIDNDTNLSDVFKVLYNAALYPISANEEATSTSTLTVANTMQAYKMYKNITTDASTNYAVPDDLVDYITSEEASNGYSYANGNSSLTTCSQGELGTMAVTDADTKSTADHTHGGSTDNYVKTSDLFTLLDKMNLEIFTASYETTSWEDEIGNRFTGLFAIYELTGASKYLLYFSEDLTIQDGYNEYRFNAGDIYMITNHAMYERSGTVVTYAVPFMNSTTGHAVYTNYMEYITNLSEYTE